MTKSKEQEHSSNLLSKNSLHIKNKLSAGSINFNKASLNIYSPLFTQKSSKGFQFAKKTEMLIYQGEKMPMGKTTRHIYSNSINDQEQFNKLMSTKINKELSASNKNQQYIIRK